MCNDASRAQRMSVGRRHFLRNMHRRPSRNARSGRASALMRPALACLRRSSPGLRNLSYPSDAWRHFDEVHAALAPWLQSAPGFRPHGAAGYGGPWLENVWISHFQAEAHAARAARKELSAVFGPYIPILVPFTDQWVHGGPRQVGQKRYRYPAGLVESLLRVLRPNVAYITVSQNDEGLAGRAELSMLRIPNVLVLSAGGYGHVPLPLLKQPEPLLASDDGGPLAGRPTLVSYVGSLDTTATGLRARMRNVVAASAAEVGFAYAVTQGLSARWSAVRLPRAIERLVARLVGAGDSWRGVMAASKTSLCPRGFGRSSYHLAETVQMGRVPIHVYSDTPWLPYEALYRDSIGFATDLARLPALLRALHVDRNASDAELARRERAIGRLRSSHFSFEGVMAQVSAFMLTPHRADLQCRRLPPSTRGEG